MSSNFNIEIGATQGDDVVCTAWASSAASSASFAVDKIPYFSSFLSGTSNGDQYPWLAIDFYTPASVSGVKIVEAVSDLSFDIEVRVGYEKPFTPGTKGVVYTTNTVCGTFTGPGNAKVQSSIECSEPIEGRYVTLQTTKRYPKLFEYDTNLKSFIQWNKIELDRSDC